MKSVCKCKNLTAKQTRFCLEYLVDLNGTQAAIRAGYSKKTANRIANENLIKPVISQRVAFLKMKRNKRVELTADEVLLELKRIAFSNICDLKIDWDKVKDWNDLTDDQKAVIAEIKVTETKGQDWTKTITEIKLHDKLKALEKLSKHTGLYEKDNKQRQPPVIILHLTQMV